jgi:DNA-binding transcriptional LysR family regulator
MTRLHSVGLALLVLSTLGNAGGPREEEFVLIVNRSNQFDSLNRSKIGFLFLRKVSRWPWGAEAEPIDLPPRESGRRWFSNQVLRITEEQVDEYWIDQRATRGVNPPIQVPNAAAARALVAARPGAIAYIPAAAVDGTVKVLKVDP